MATKAEILPPKKSSENLHALVALPDDKNLPAVGHPALHRYLQEISQHQLLSREETEELAIRFQETGDPDAAYKLVTANLRLVVKVAMDNLKFVGEVNHAKDERH